MTKRAIVNGETGALSDICDTGDEFDIYSGPDATQKWCDVPDDVTYEHTMINGKIWHRRDLEDKQFTATTERVLAYGPMGEQMDMMYKDQVDGGTRWKDHIAKVKANLAAPSSLDAYDNDPKKVQQYGRMAWEAYDEAYEMPGDRMREAQVRMIRNFAAQPEANKE